MASSSAAAMNENDLLSFSNPNFQLGDAVNCNTTASSSSTVVSNAIGMVNDGNVGDLHGGRPLHNHDQDDDDPYDEIYQKLESVCNFQKPLTVKNRRNYAALDINSMGIDLNNDQVTTDATTGHRVTTITTTTTTTTTEADANSNIDLSNSMATMAAATTTTTKQRAARDITDNEQRLSNRSEGGGGGGGFYDYFICPDRSRSGSGSGRPELLDDGGRLCKSNESSSSSSSSASSSPLLKLALATDNGNGIGNYDDAASMDLNSPDDIDGVRCGSVSVMTSSEEDVGGMSIIPHVPGQLNDDLYAVLVKRPVGQKPTTPAEDRKDEDTSLLQVDDGDGDGNGLPTTLDNCNRNSSSSNSDHQPPTEPLPPGWEKHEDNDGAYYWHIKSGTIQRELPTPTPPPLVTPTGAESKIFKSTDESIGAVAVPDTMCISTAHVVSLPQIDNKDKRRSLQMPTTTQQDFKDKTVPIRFAVRSLGWVEIAEEDLTPERSSKAVNKCIVDLSLGRNDILDVVGRWGDGKDLYMDLDNSSLKLVDPENLTVLNTQPIHTIRVWGVGRDNGRDFAYVARDRVSRKHMCHVFRCDTPARTIANTLRDICKRIMIERSNQMAWQQQQSMCGRPSMSTDQQIQQQQLQQQHRSSRQQLNHMSTSTSLMALATSSTTGNGSSTTPSSSTSSTSASSSSSSSSSSTCVTRGSLVRPTNLPTEQRRFQSKGTVTTYSAQSFPTPMEEPKKILKVHYLGMTDVSKPTGMDVLNSAVDQMTTTVPMDKWHLVNVAIAPSTITISELGRDGKQLAECRVRFLSFLGIGKNVKHCAFIMHTAQDEFVAHVFHCEPSSGALCKTIEAACKLRYQKCLDAHPPGSEKRLGDGQNVRGLGATIKNVLGTFTSGKRSKSTDS